MAADTVRCPVLRNNITLVSDTAGYITKIVCPQLNTATHVCELKAKDKNFLHLTVLIASDTALGTREIICHYGNPRTARENVDKFLGRS